MVSWPDPGTRVTVRYRRPAGSVPPLTDAVGQLLAVDPLVRVRTKSGVVVEIRALEHAAAAAWPGAEHTWLDGWLLRAGRGADLTANSAVPVQFSAQASTVGAIVDWYERRGLTPRLAIPDRVLALPPGLIAERTEQLLVRDLSDVVTPEADPSIRLTPRPDEGWLRMHEGEIPVEVLTAVIDGELAFGAHGDAVVARAAVTETPDGARWVGISAVRSAHSADHQAAARLCDALLTWGASRGATRGYMRVPDTGAETLAGALGFRLHHRRRYVPVRQGVWDSV
jgi:N-acetylglutamate synthase